MLIIHENHASYKIKKSGEVGGTRDSTTHSKCSHSVQGVAIDLSGYEGKYKVGYPKSWVVINTATWKRRHTSLCRRSQG